MPTDDNVLNLTTSSEKTGVATVATMAIAALFDDTQPTDLQRSREAYKRAAARRRERIAVAQFEQAFGHTDDCATVDDFDADCTCR